MPHLRRLWLPIFSVFWLAADPAAAQEIGKLYETRPPAGSAFIRTALIGGLNRGAKVEISTTDFSVAGNDIASRYRALRIDQPVSLSINGRGLGQITLMSDKFYTLVIGGDDEHWQHFVMDEGQGSVNDLKAELRFFNLIPHCDASLRIAGGPTIFDVAEFVSVKSRTINPVQAQLEASCNGRGATFRLPQLRPGDHYSLFFREVANQPDLTGQLDETEPYRDR